MIMEEWKPKTDLGRRVKARQITDINEILDNGWTILEPQITDTLLPGMEHDLLMIGQSKGKFGGGRRRVFRQTQKKTQEGNKPHFAAYAVIGNGDGFVGLGYGKARETVPAREKAVRQAKINVFKVARGSGSWESRVKEPHTVPFSVEGRCGSVRVRLMPAPKGKGLVAEKEVQKILKAAGIQDVWMQSFGQTKNKVNLIKATEQALRKLVTTKLRDADIANLAVVYGNTKPLAIASPDEIMQRERPSRKISVEKPAKSEDKPKAPAKGAAKPAPKSPAKTEQVKEAKAPAKKAEPAKKQTAPTEASGTPLSGISGVGPARVKKLNSAGVSSVEQVASMEVADLAEKAGIAEGNAQNIIEAAKDLVGGKK